MRLLASGAALRKMAKHDRRRAESYMDKVIDNLARTMQPGRNAALNGTAWTLGRWVAVGALEQSVLRTGSMTQ